MDTGRHEALYLALLVTAAGLWSFRVYAEAPGAPRQWQSVEIFEGASPQEMDVFMEAMNASLGVECEHCHEPNLWHLETPEKETARAMMRMIGRLSDIGFEALDVPTCWTCHRGSATPAENEATGDVSYPPTAFSASPGTAGEVYRNLEQYATISAGELPAVMEAYSRALGVGCDYCHAPGDWASDEKVSKLLARTMLDVEVQIEREYFEAGANLSCWTCHQGEVVPEMTIPPDRMSIE